MFVELVESFEIGFKKRSKVAFFKLEVKSLGLLDFALFCFLE